MKILYFLPVLLLYVFYSSASLGGEREIRNYQGNPLDPFHREYDNSIKGPQKVEKGSYMLVVDGMVKKTLTLSYEKVLSYPSEERVITLYCVEGWKERLLFEGVRLSSLLKSAGVEKGVTTVIFYAEDGYSSALEYDFVLKKDLILAYKINGLVLDEKRGFPFQLVAEDKLGYKWVKWVTRIELTDRPYLGFWEKRGYSNEADIPKNKIKSSPPVVPRD